MREIITDDVGQVKVGGVLLPGVFESLEVAGSLRIDEAEVEGQSGTTKQPLGFADAEVTLSIRLLTDEESTCYDKCKEIVRLFQGTDQYAQPYVCRIVNRHTALWGIDEVLFKELRTSEDNSDDTMRAVLVFVEYVPAVVLAEEVAPEPPKMAPGQMPPETSISRQPGDSNGLTVVDKAALLRARANYPAADTDQVNRE